MARIYIKTEYIQEEINPISEPGTISPAAASTLSFKLGLEPDLVMVRQLEAAVRIYGI